MFTITYITGPRTARVVRAITTPNEATAWATLAALTASPVVIRPRLWARGRLIGG